MQPSTPTSMPGRRFLCELICLRRIRTVCSAFSRMEQVLSSTKSAPAKSSVVSKPSPARMLDTISESEKFIWQP